VICFVLDGWFGEVLHRAWGLDRNFVVRVICGGLIGSSPPARTPAAPSKFGGQEDRSGMGHPFESDVGHRSLDRESGN